MCEAFPTVEATLRRLADNLLTYGVCGCVCDPPSFAQSEVMAPARGRGAIAPRALKSKTKSKHNEDGHSTWMVIPSGWLFVVHCYSELMIIPRGWLFRVDGYSGCMVIPRGPTSTQSSNPSNKDAFRLSHCRKLSLRRWVIVPSVQSQCGAVCKDHQVHPRAPQEHHLGPLVAPCVSRGRPWGALASQNAS